MNILAFFLRVGSDSACPIAVSQGIQALPVLGCSFAGRRRLKRISRAGYAILMQPVALPHAGSAFRGGESRQSPAQLSG